MAKSVLCETNPIQKILNSLPIKIINEPYIHFLTFQDFKSIESYCQLIDIKLFSYVLFVTELVSKYITLKA